MNRSRNSLVAAALRDEEWVLWMDVDLHTYPKDIIQRLLSAHKSIVVPNVVMRYSLNLES